jgi:hypothetical protein
MRLKVVEADLLDITANDALELRNEINKATGGTCFKKNEYPALHKLYTLLTGMFDSAVHNVHFISKREEQP